MIRNLLLALIFPALFCSCHVGRFFIYNFADVRDHKKFPKKEIHRSEQPFFFTDASQAGLIKLPESFRGKRDKHSFATALKKSGTVAFLVIRNDSILYQWHRPGRKRSDITTSFSMSKSFVSALIGIAISEGKIRSTDEPITNYIDFLDTAAFSKVTIRHLLDMRSGIRFNEGYFNPFGDIAKYYYGKSIRKYLSKLKMEEEPGKRFRYISLNTELLALVIEKATGMPVTAYLQEKIWTPLGMEFDASWSVDSRKNQMEKAFCCINGRAVDYAKLGRLYANQGKWNGRQIVPEDWVKEAWQFREFKNNYVYSSHWWHTRDFISAKDTCMMEKPYFLMREANKPQQFVVRPGNDLFAQGLLGQYLYIYPEKKIVIVRVAKREGWKISWPTLFKEIAKTN